MPRPLWLVPSVDDIRAETDLQPGELFTTVSDVPDEERLVALINTQIETQSAYVWGELQREAKPLSFPSTVKQLETAFPFEALEGESDEEVAQSREMYEEANLQTIETQKENARLTVKERTIAKLYDSAMGDEAKERKAAHYANASALLSSATKDLKKTRAHYRFNTSAHLT